MRTKKVSVIITSYNQKNYLFQAVRSVLNQTYPVHEIIIADDQSTDGSIELIKDFAREFPDCVRPVLNYVNQGIPKNRNSGLEHVSGKYVCILDGDDRFLATNIEKMLGFLSANPDFRCVYSNVNFVDAYGKFLKVRDKENQPSGEIFYEIAYGQFGMLRNMIFDFELLQREGFFDERLPRYDGFDLTLRLARKCRIGYIFEPLAEYRVYPTSDSKGLRAKDHIRDLEVILAKMKPWWEELPQSLKENLWKVWKRRMVNFYRNDLKENPSTVKLMILPMELIAKKYIKSSEYFKYIQLLKKDIAVTDKKTEN